ncbi:MAG: Lrp/AsnC family transcriptional regulator [Candidatus Nanoarchaeia archaeon]
MTIKLDLKDKKILTLLDGDARLSNSQLGKKVGLSKPAVEYRLKRFEKNNVIFNFYTVVDFTRLGYSQYKLYLKFQDTTLEDEKRIIGHFKDQECVMWVAEIRGRWDLAVSIISKSNFDFGKILGEFMDNFAKFVLAKDVLLTEYSPIYARRYLTDTKQSEFIYGVPKENYSLDEEEFKILKILATDARINIVDLAEKTKLTRDIVNYRIKKLTKDKIITQYRCFLNLANLGINHYKLILRTKNFDEQAQKRLKSYIECNKKATQYLKLIGSWDCEIEFETESEDELYHILNEIRKEFSDIIRDFDILRIIENHKFSFFPF